jgi:hypothetical protein
MSEMRIRGTLDTRNYERGVDKMRQKNEKFGSGLDKIKSRIGMAFKVTAILAFGRAIMRGVAGLVRMGGEIKNLAESVGVAAESLQRMTAVIEDGGGKQQNLVNGLNRVRDAQGAVVDGDQLMIKAIERLGISQEEFVSLDTEGAFRRIASAITAAGNSADAMNAASDILGKRDVKNLVNGMNALARETGRASDDILVLSQRSASALDIAGNRFRRFGQNIKTGFAEIAGDLAAMIFKADVADAKKQAEELARIEVNERAAAVEKVKQQRLQALEEVKKKEQEILEKQQEQIAKIERSVKIEIDTDSIRKIGGFAGAQVSEQLRLIKQQTEIARKVEEYQRTLPQIEKNTREGGGLA